MKHRPPTERTQALAAYRHLIDTYHATLDLMSARGREDLDRHVTDAVAYVEMLFALSPAPNRILDVGSGVGLPGIVIAAHLQDVAMELIERRTKRATFLRMAVAAVGAGEDVVVRCGDVRELEGPPVDVVIAQAVARFEAVVAWTRDRHAPRTVVLARKGASWREEVEAVASAGIEVELVATRPLSEGGTLVAIRV